MHKCPPKPNKIQGVLHASDTTAPVANQQRLSTQSNIPHNPLFYINTLGINNVVYAMVSHNQPES